MTEQKIGSRDAILVEIEREGKFSSTETVFLRAQLSQLAVPTGHSIRMTVRRHLESGVRLFEFRADVFDASLLKQTQAPVPVGG